MRNCLVVGSGRSGTSMLAGMLHKSGWNTGDDYLDARLANPSGFFEDSYVNRLNNRMLRTVIPAPPLDGVRFVRELARPITGRLFPNRVPNGSLWMAIPPTPPTMPDGLAEEIQQLVANKPFAYKDPRFSHTIHLWEPLLPVGTLKICVFREPTRTARSIATEMRTRRYRHMRLDYPGALAVWQAAYSRAINMADESWVFVHFDQILHDSQPHLERALGRRLDRSNIDPSLKRSSDDGKVPNAVNRIYLRLCEAAGFRPIVPLKLSD